MIVSLDNNRWWPYFIVGLFCTNPSVPCLDAKNSAFARSVWFHRHKCSHNRLNIYSRQSKCLHFPSCDKTSIPCVEHNYRSSSQPTGMQYRLTAPPHGLYSYGCQLWNTIQLLRTQSSGKRLNDDDGFHFSTSILRFCLQTSRPCLKPHSSSINSKRFVDTTFVSISLSNHISCVTTRYSWSFWFPDKSRPLSHLGLRQLKNEIQETSI